MEELIKEKRWDKALEKAIYEEWQNTKAFEFDPSSKKPVFSIDTPPPYVNAPVHIGQAATYILMDMFARYRRMTGHNVLFTLGLDNNGIPIEMAAEKKFKKAIYTVDREEFLKMCKSILEEGTVKSSETFLRSGISFNSYTSGPNLGDRYLTDSPEYRQLTQGTFIDMWKKGLIYEDKRTNNYCPGCRVTLADAEVLYEEINTKFIDVKFKVKETGDEIVIATTRPELLGSCAAVVFHPSDERYKNLEGKHAIVPIFNKEVKLIPHTLADPEKGTGLVMMCSFGDLHDIRFFREMNLEPIYAIEKDGKMNKNAGPLEGLRVKPARKKIIELLKEGDFVKAEHDLLHRTPICERSKDHIEFIAMEEFYVKQLGQKEKMLEIAEKLNFFDPRSKQILINWINGLSIDWPISRRRYYATEVPLWYCNDCKKPYLPPKGKYYQPWKEDPPVDKCPECGHDKFTGETRVFDTWFDSSISPLYILGYERHPEFFKKNPQCSVRPQGKEIIRTWLYYTLLKCYHLTGNQIFKDVWINYHIVDDKGKKMSKSVGNIIDPQKILDQYGAEPLRFWTAAEGNLTQTDFRCSFDRIGAAGKTLAKLWNVARFVSIFPKPAPDKPPAKLRDLDKWILTELSELTKSTTESYEKYDFHNPAIKIRHFIWETFASHYLELVKNRAYNTEEVYSKEDQETAVWVLYHCLSTLFKLLAPIIPFITSKLYKDIYGEDVHHQSFPEPDEKHDIGISTTDLEELNSAIWKAKKEAGKSLKDDAESVTVPEKFKPLERDLIQTHHIKSINYGELKIII